MELIKTGRECFGNIFFTPRKEHQRSWVPKITRSAEADRADALH